ncbi:hypothetical protein STEG23_025204, partial [Scotinomys teguina]
MWSRRSGSGSYGSVCESGMGGADPAAPGGLHRGSPDPASNGRLIAAASSRPGRKMRSGKHPRPTRYVCGSLACSANGGQKGAPGTGDTSYFIFSDHRLFFHNHRYLEFSILDIHHNCLILTPQTLFAKERLEVPIIRGSHSLRVLLVLCMAARTSMTTPLAGLGYAFIDIFILFTVSLTKSKMLRIWGQGDPPLGTYMPD